MNNYFLTLWHTLQIGSLIDCHEQSDLSKSELTNQVSLLLRNTLSVLGLHLIFKSSSAMRISSTIGSQHSHLAEEAF